MADADDSPVRRTRTVAVRLTDAEHAAWRAAAAAEGRRQLGAWIRQSAVAGYLSGSGPRRPGGGPEVAGELAGLRQQLARVGNNVNQLARAAHRGADVDDAVLAEAVVALGRIADVAERIETGGQP